MTIKCENCGATLQQDPDRAIAFCSYCGYAVKQPEDLIDLAKYTMKHNEQVRQRIVQETREDTTVSEKRKRIAWIMGGIAVILIIAAIVIGTNLETWKLQAKVNHINELIVSGEYDEALIEAQTIRKTNEGWFGIQVTDKHWERQREALIELIKQKQKEAK